MSHTPNAHPHKIRPTIHRKILSRALVDFFNAVKKRRDDNGGVQTRSEKADIVKQRAADLLQVFSDAQADESVNYYLHAAYHHLPELIRRCPIEVDDASGCCIEHAHQTVKRAML